MFNFLSETKISKLVQMCLNFIYLLGNLMERLHKTEWQNIECKWKNKVS